MSDYFCQWCFDRGLRYPDDGLPWRHGLGCPNAQSETSEIGETLQQTHERVCRESWDREQKLRAEIEELRKVCRDQAEWIEELRSRGPLGKLIEVSQLRAREERQGMTQSVNGSQSYNMHAYAANRIESLLLACGIPVIAPNAEDERREASDSATC